MARAVMERTVVDVVPAGCAAGSLVRAQRLVTSRCNAVLAPLALTFPTFETLVGLRWSPDGALSLSVLALHLEVTPAKVTKLVDRLEGAGFVERRPHPSDRRAVVAAMTAAGSEVVERAIEALDAIDFGLAPLADEERDRLLELTRAVRGR